jgi:hypothetical protein
VLGEIPDEVAAELGDNGVGAEYLSDQVTLRVGTRE